MIIGITGKIGAGKSTVTSILEEAGWHTIDSDKVVHKLYETGNRGAEKIQTFFGEEYLNQNGSVDRKKLTRALLKNTKKWDILNRLIHPLVLDELKREIKKHNQQNIAIEIQVLNERIFGDLFDQIWIIEASNETRNKRSKRNKRETEAIEAQQEASKIPKTAIRINNSGSKKELKSSIIQLCPPMK